MRSTEDTWKQIQLEEQTPNNDGGFSMDALLTTGSNHFARSPEYRPGYRTLAASIQPLLDRQRELRRQLGAHTEVLSDEIDESLRPAL
eukprot:386990-Pyramimonas_sp.AAC.2